MSNINTYWRTLAAAVVAAAVLLLLVELSLGRLVKTTILAQAEASAIRWASEFERSMPDIHRLANTGDATQEQADFVKAAITGSDIFRFILFSAEGHLVYVSDEAVYRSEDAEQVNPTPLRVIRTGQMDISIHDGREKDNRPDLYVEAYVGIANASGDPIGVIEVYVDVAHLAAALRAKFDILSEFLIIASAMIYLIPALLLVHRNSQLRQRDQELLRISLSDSLTGALNRGAFTDKLAEVFADAGHERSIGLLFTDLDRFKDANDRFGHAVGDRILQQFSDSLSSIVGEEGYVGRVGGDEFVVLLPRTDRTRLMALGKRILGARLVPPDLLGQVRDIGVSIGTHLSVGPESPDAALHAADIALYRAKHEGRGRIVEYGSDLASLDQRRRHVEDSLRNALADGGLFLEYQPIMKADGRTASGFEALARLRDPDGGVIAPGEFIPVAEETGLIDDLGRWVLRTAIATAATWPETVTLSVNLSAQQFRAGDIPAFVAGQLDRVGLPPGRLILEIAESLLLSDRDGVTEQLVALKSQGIAISLDDFGTGYSSLGYLWKYRFDQIKIDRTFIEGHDFYTERYAKVIETIVVLGHHIRMDVVVEGIETQVQFDAMKDIGCDLYQGFLFSRPIGEDRIAEFLAQPLVRQAI